MVGLHLYHRKGKHHFQPSLGAVGSSVRTMLGEGGEPKISVPGFAERAGETLCNYPRIRAVYIDSREIPAATQVQAGMQGQAGCQPPPANQGGEASPGKGWRPMQ